eukprot:g738.t1
MTVDVHLNQLHVEWNPDTIVAVQTFFNDGDDNAYVSQAAASVEKEGSAISCDSGAIASPSGKVGSATAVDQELCVQDDIRPAKTMVLSASMQSVSITFNKERRKRKLAKLAMTNTQFQYISYSDDTYDCSGSLGNLVLKDLTSANTIYPEVLGICESSGTSLVRFGYETFNSRRFDFPGHDSFLRLEFSPMRFVYFNLLWMELIDYLWEGILAEAVWGGLQAVAQIAVNHYAAVSRNKIDILLSAPTLWAPRLRVLHDKLTVSASMVSVTNDFVATTRPALDQDGKEVHSKAVAAWEGRMKISIEGLDIFDSLPTLQGEGKRAHSLLREPLGLSFQVVRLLDPRDWDPMSIPVEITNIGVALTRAQWCLLVDVMYDNLWAEVDFGDVGSLTTTGAASEGTIEYTYDADGPLMPFNVNIVLSSISLELLKSYSTTTRIVAGSVTHNVEDVVMIRAEARRCECALTRGTDGVTSIDVALYEVDVEDPRRPKGSPYRWLMASTSESMHESTTHLGHSADLCDEGDEEEVKFTATGMSSALGGSCLNQTANPVEQDSQQKIRTNTPQVVMRYKAVDISSEAEEADAGSAFKAAACKQLLGPSVESWLDLSLNNICIIAVFGTFFDAYTFFWPADGSWTSTPVPNSEESQSSLSSQSASTTPSTTLLLAPALARRHTKVVVVAPHIVFLESLEDPKSRALVFTGLVHLRYTDTIDMRTGLTASSILSKRIVGTREVETELTLNDMQSFVHFGARNAIDASSSDDGGAFRHGNAEVELDVPCIAVLEPVSMRCAVRTQARICACAAAGNPTCSHCICEPVPPDMRRSADVDVDALHMELSWQHYRVIAGIIDGWKVDNSTDSDGVATVDTSPQSSGDNGDKGSSTFFDVGFDTLPLGIHLHERSGAAVVSRVSRTRFAPVNTKRVLEMQADETPFGFDDAATIAMEIAADKSKTLNDTVPKRRSASSETTTKRCYSSVAISPRRGDVLVAVGGESVVNLTFETVVQRVRAACSDLKQIFDAAKGSCDSAAQPLVLRFRRVSDVSKTAMQMAAASAGQAVASMLLGDTSRPSMCNDTSPEVASPPVAALDKLTVRCDEIGATLIDDFTHCQQSGRGAETATADGLPLLRFSGHSLQLDWSCNTRDVQGNNTESGSDGCDAANMDTNANIIARMTAGADYFNSAVAEWEPIFEPWDAECSVALAAAAARVAPVASHQQQTGHGVDYTSAPRMVGGAPLDAPRVRIHATLSSKGVMNINLSEALLARLAQVQWQALGQYHDQFEMTQKTMETAGTATDVAFAPYRVVNSTGAGLTYWLEPMPSIADKGADVQGPAPRQKSRTRCVKYRLEKAASAPLQAQHTRLRTTVATSSSKAGTATRSKKHSRSFSHLGVEVGSGDFGTVRVRGRGRGRGELGFCVELDGGFAPLLHLPLHGDASASAASVRGPLGQNGRSTVGGGSATVHDLLPTSPSTRIGTKVVWEVQLVGGVRVLTLRSTVKIVNLSTVPIELQVFHAAVENRQHLGALSPHDEVSLPLELAPPVAREVRVRPSSRLRFKHQGGIDDDHVAGEVTGVPSHEWSGRIALGTISAGTLHMPVQCSPAIAGGDLIASDDQGTADGISHMFFAVDIVTELVGPAGVGGVTGVMGTFELQQLVSIILRPPLTLRNRLPCPLHARVWDGGERECTDVVLSQGSRRDMHGVEVQSLPSQQGLGSGTVSGACAAPTMLLRIAGLLWSAPVRLLLPSEDGPAAYTGGDVGEDVEASDETARLRDIWGDAGGGYSSDDDDPSNNVSLGRGALPQQRRRTAMKRRLTLQDSAGGHVDLMLQSTRSSGGGAGLVVTIFVEYWVVNRSPLPLVFGEAKPEDSSVGAKAMGDLKEAVVGSVARTEQTGTGESSALHRDLGRVILAPMQMNEVVVELFENERYKPLFGWCAPFMPLDRPHWCDQWRQPMDRESVRLPSEHWEWAGAWAEERDKQLSGEGNGSVEWDGWEYARDFGDLKDCWSKDTFHERRSMALVRRRRWFRLRRLKAEIVEQMTLLRDQKSDTLLHDLQRRNTATAPLPPCCLFSPRWGFLSLQTQSTRWSSPVPVSSEGSRGVVELMERRLTPQKSAKTRTESTDADSRGDCFVHELAVAVERAPGRYNRSLLVEIMARYTITNGARRPLLMRQAGHGVRRAVVLQPGESRPFHWGDASLPRLARVGVLDDVTGWPRWSGDLSLDALGDCPVLIRGLSSDTPTDAVVQANAASTDMTVIRVEVRLQGSGPATHILMREELELHPLIEIRNKSKFPVWYRQCRKNRGSEHAVARAEIDTESDTDVVCSSLLLEPGRRAIFGWDYPEEARKLELSLDEYNTQDGAHSKIAGKDRSVSGKLRSIGQHLAHELDETVKGIGMSGINVGGVRRHHIDIDDVGFSTTIERQRPRYAKLHALVDADGPTKVVILTSLGSSGVADSGRRRRQQQKNVALKAVHGNIEEHMVSPRPVPHAKESGTQFADAPETVSSFGGSAPPPHSQLEHAREHGSAAQAMSAETGTPQIPPVDVSLSFALALAEVGVSLVDVDEVLPETTIERDGVPAIKDTKLRFAAAGGAPVSTRVDEGGLVQNTPRKLQGDATLAMAAAAAAQPRELHRSGSAVQQVTRLCAPAELLYLSLKDVSIEATAVHTHQALMLRFSHLQIDSYMPGCAFPVVFAPAAADVTKTSQRSKAAAAAAVAASVTAGSGNEDGSSNATSSPPPLPPFFQLSLVKPYHPVNEFYEYVSLLVQEFNLSAEQPLLLRLMRFGRRAMSCFGEGGESTSDNPASLQALFAPYTAPCPLSWLDSAQTTSDGVGAVAAATADRRLYFNLLHIQPIKANLSFVMIPESASAVYSGLNPIRLLLQLMQRVDACQLRISALSMRHVLQSDAVLRAALVQHFRSQLQRQLLSVVGSLNVLGNPAGLLRNLTDGMHDLWYEPKQGLVEGGGAEGFARGLGKVSLLYSLYFDHV